jgi:iron complex outermembrane recepter protein
MRTILLILFVGLSFFSTKAQHVSGLVKNAEGRSATGATVTLLKDTLVIKLALTNRDGIYNFDDIKKGTYKIAVSYSGHTTYESPSFNVDTNVAIADIHLSQNISTLQGITVTTRKPPIEVKSDKTIINIEGIVSAIGSDALDLLRKSPGVMVDNNENLSISGKSGAQVYIDGRPLLLVGTDLADYLKTIQSSQIEAIEIITNPSAKYEAAGSAGIINIRSKRNKSFGTNGSVNAGWNVGTFAKYNAGFSLNHRKRNTNIYGNYNYNDGRNDLLLDLYRITKDTLFDQRGNIITNNRSHTIKSGIDYIINKKSGLSFIVNGNFGNPISLNSSYTPIIGRSTNEVNRILISDNRIDLKRNSITLNLHYNYVDSNGKGFTLNLDHGVHDLRNDQIQPNRYYSPTGSFINDRIFQMVTSTDIDISSLKADYEQNLAKGKLSLGTKLSYINTDNDFQRYDVYNNTRYLDTDRSNDFEYKEAINAGYVNYDRELKGLTIQAGLRVENTISEGKLTGTKMPGGGYSNTKSGFKRRYTDFFPSVAISFNKNPTNHWNLSYSRRIERPAYRDLNPFEFRLDEYTFQKGNINLRPQYTNNISVAYSYKQKLNLSANYSKITDIFIELFDTTERNKAFLIKQNLASQDIIGLTANYSIFIGRFAFYMNANSFYSLFKANYGTGRTIDVNAFGLNLFSRNTFKFGEKKEWTAELSGFYNAPTIYEAIFSGKAIYGVDAGIQKTILKEKATIAASLSDVFKTVEFSGTAAFAGQTTNAITRWESRQFKLSFNLRFGNNQVKAAKQRNTGAEEENKRVTQNGRAGATN